MMLMLMTTMMKFVFETFYMKPLFNQTVFRAVVAPSFSTKSHWTNNILTRKHTNDINIHLLCLFESLTRSNHRAIFYILSSQNLNVFFFALIHVKYVENVYHLQIKTIWMTVFVRFYPSKLPCWVEVSHGNLNIFKIKKENIFIFLHVGLTLLKFHMIACVILVCVKA